MTFNFQPNSLIYIMSKTTVVCVQFNTQRADTLVDVIIECMVHCVYYSAIYRHITVCFIQNKFNRMGGGRRMHTAYYTCELDVRPLQQRSRLSTEQNVHVKRQKPTPTQHFPPTECIDLQLAAIRTIQYEDGTPWLTPFLDISPLLQVFVKRIYLRGIMMIIPR